MSNLNRSAFQGHPFHLVSPSPWPIFTCISLLTLTTSGVLTMHGFTNAGFWLSCALVLVMSSMFFWFRDEVSEGRAKSLLRYLLNFNYTLKITKSITAEKVENYLSNFFAKPYNKTGNYYKDSK